MTIYGVKTTVRPLSLTRSLNQQFIKPPQNLSPSQTKLKDKKHILNYILLAFKRCILFSRRLTCSKPFWMHCGLVVIDKRGLRCLDGCPELGSPGRLKPSQRHRSLASRSCQVKHSHHLSSLTFNVTKAQVEKYNASIPHWGSVGRFPDVKMTSGYMAVFFISIDRMPILMPTPDDSDPLFALVIARGYYLHHVQEADQDSASGSL